jgi:hypothetical protein
MNKPVFLFPIILSALTLSAQTADILVTDTSESQSHWAIQSRDEQKQLIAALPNSTQLIILGVGGSVRRLYEGTLDPAHRVAAGAIIDALPMKDQNTALWEGVSEALRLTAALTGTSKNIWVFTDGQNSPLPKSRFRGKHFNRILDEVSLPSDTQIYIRVFGAEQVVSTKPSIHILKSAPAWSTIVPGKATARPRDTGPVNTPHPVSPVSREILPIVGIFALISAASVLAILAIIIARRKRANDIVADVRPISAAPPESFDEPQPRRIFSIFIDGRTEPIVLGTDQRTEVVIGGATTADVYLPACEQQMARFTLHDLRSQQAIMIRNDGIGEIEVGRRRIASGNTVRLPDKPVEMRIGSQIIHVLGETVMIGGI